MNIFIKNAIFAVLTFLTVSQGLCSDSELKESFEVSGASGSLNFRHIKEEDKPILEDLPELTKARFPNGIDKRFDNLLTRQNDYGNPYSAVVFFSSETPVAIVVYGIMPSTDYDPDHKDIIDFWMEKGVTRRKESADVSSYAKEDIEQIDTLGIGMMLPLLFDGISSENRKDVIQLATDVFMSLHMDGYLLPRGGSTPKFVISLLKSDESSDEYSLLKDGYLEADFEEERRDGFKGFYNDERVLMHLDVPMKDDFENAKKAIEERSSLKIR